MPKNKLIMQVIIKSQLTSNPKKYKIQLSNNIKTLSTRQTPKRRVVERQLNQKKSCINLVIVKTIR